MNDDKYLDGAFFKNYFGMKLSNATSETPVSPTSEYFSRNDKSRKSTIKQAVNSIFKNLFRTKHHKDDSQLYMGSKNISSSAHTVPF